MHDSNAFPTLDSDGRINVDGEMNYQFRSFPSAFFVSDPEISKTIFSDCESAFSARAQKQDGNYSEGSTFFIHAMDEPNSTLERFAKRIFEFHTAGANFDPSNSGAEWWTLFIEGEDDVGFHFDKDYGMESFGLNIYPHIGTVTYFSNIGGPTLMFEKPGPRIYGGSLSGPIDAAFLSFPMFGKHICFDGRFLHAAPVEIAQLWSSALEMDNKSGECIGNGNDHTLNQNPGRTQCGRNSTKETAGKMKQNEFSSKKKSPKNKQRGQKKQKNRRVTFLVNVWLNHKPLHAERFSKHRQGRLSNLRIPPNFVGEWIEEIPTVINVVGQTKLTNFNWEFTGENSEQHSVIAAIPSSPPIEGWGPGKSFSIHFQNGLKAFVD